MAFCPGFQEPGRRLRVRTGPVAEVRCNSLIDSLYRVSGPSILHMSGSGLDVGDPERRKSCTQEPPVSANELTVVKKSLGFGIRLM